ncbi:hypothetical protein SNEBB_003322 [Seison nebaliae]|nr:hypothetical protein SNEBB_003322 [Seison nebaliae]
MGEGITGLNESNAELISGSNISINSNCQRDSTEIEQQNITVCCRIRPLTKDELAFGERSIAYLVNSDQRHEESNSPLGVSRSPNLIVLLDPTDESEDVLRTNRTREKHFMFDTSCDQKSNQMEVYERTTKNVVSAVMDGYNATVFAYGATGAGKTYTMLGTDENPGIMFCAVKDMFDSIAENDEHQKCRVTVSYFEIYNELIRDLLVTDNHMSNEYLELREDNRGEIKVIGLSEMHVQHVSQMMDWLKRGNQARTQEPTKANKTSSRSHAVLQVTIRQRNRLRGINQEEKTGRLYMIDLAGSERASQTQNTGKRMIEGAHINRSLLALGNCINALSDKNGSKYINYRDSKLTRILKDSLGGNSKTVMIAHVNPASSHFEDSRNTLMYADRAKMIRTKAKRNIIDVNYHISQYQQIIQELASEIVKLKEEREELLELKLQFLSSRTSNNRRNERKNCDSPDSMSRQANNGPKNSRHILQPLQKSVPKNDSDDSDNENEENNNPNSDEKIKLKVRETFTKRLELKKEIGEIDCQIVGCSDRITFAKILMQYLERSLKASHRSAFRDLKYKDLTIKDIEKKYEECKTDINNAKVEKMALEKQKKKLEKSYGDLRKEIDQMKRKFRDQPLKQKTKKSLALIVDLHEREMIATEMFIENLKTSSSSGWNDNYLDAVENRQMVYDKVAKEQKKLIDENGIILPTHLQFLHGQLERLSDMKIRLEKQMKRNIVATKFKPLLPIATKALPKQKNSQENSLQINEMSRSSSYDDISSSYNSSISISRERSTIIDNFLEDSSNNKSSKRIGRSDTATLVTDIDQLNSSSDNENTCSIDLSTQSSKNYPVVNRQHLPHIQPLNKKDNMQNKELNKNVRQQTRGIAAKAAQKKANMAHDELMKDLGLDKKELFSSSYSNNNNNHHHDNYHSKGNIKSNGNGGKLKNNVTINMNPKVKYINDTGNKTGSNGGNRRKSLSEIKSNNSTVNTAIGVERSISKTDGNMKQRTSKTENIERPKRNFIMENKNSQTNSKSSLTSFRGSNDANKKENKKKNSLDKNTSTTTTTNNNNGKIQKKDGNENKQLKNFETIPNYRRVPDMSVKGSNKKKN